MAGRQRPALLRIKLAALLLFSSSSVMAGGTVDSRAEADALIAQLYAAGHFSGAIILGHDGRIVWSGSAGRADATRPFTIDTIADGGSMAKTVTAAAIWHLIANGRITLDDPVQRHIGEFPYSNVTVRHLLSHMAGLPDIDPFAPLPDSGAPIDNRALQAFMQRQSTQPLFTPGTRFEYCNICFSTLALLVERKSGQSYSEFAVAGLLRKAGAATAFVRPVRLDQWPGPRTIGYSSARNDAEISDIYDNEAIYGESNIQFSARDLHAWASAWAAGRVLPKKLRDAAMAPARTDSALSALNLSNWYCHQNQCYFTGHHRGFFSFALWDRASRRTAVFISNSTLPPPLHPWLFRSLVALGEGRHAAPMPAIPRAEAEVDLNAVAGRYQLPRVGKVTIRRDGDTVIIARSGAPELRAFPVGYATLYVPGSDVYLSFGEGPVLRWDSLFVQYEGPRLDRL